MSTWIGKDIDNVIRMQLDYEPASDYMELSWEEVQNYENPEKRHLIRSLAVPNTKLKWVCAINYKTELIKGVRLEPEFELSEDGLLEETIYYMVDEVHNTKKPVIKITENYTYFEGDMDLNPAERGVRSRTKTWQYYFEDGTLDESGENSNTKMKLYKTNRQILDVGENRRTNITRVLSERTGGALVVLGVFVDDSNSKAKKKAYDALRNISRAYSADFTEFRLYANTRIYQSIETDTQFAWLDTFVPTKEQLIDSGKSQAEADAYQSYIDGLFLNDAQGKTVRNYFVEKLKGLVN